MQKSGINAAPILKAIRPALRKPFGNPQAGLLFWACGIEN